MFLRHRGGVYRTPRLRPGAPPGEYPGVDAPDTRYARTPDGVYLAYQTVGDGPIDIAWQFDTLGDVDLVWEDEMTGRMFAGLQGFSRLILQDRKSTRLNSSH